MKEKIPITILKAFEKFVHLNGDKFENVEPGDSLLKVVGLGKASNFYFTVKSSNLNANYKQIIEVERCPKAENSLDSVTSNVEINQLQATFNAWLGFISSYETIKSFYDDAILQSYADDYYTEFEILDEDAVKKPFTVNQLLLLDKHLEEIEMGISEFQNEENETEVALVISEVKLLREGITRKPQAKVMKELSRVWARIAKVGLPAVKEFVNEAKKQLIKDGVRTLIDAATDLIS